MNRALVLGASGTLGRRIVRLAARTLPELELVAASRSGASVAHATRSLALDLSDVRAVGAALDSADVLVNAVGPYDYDPAPLVAACVAAGAGYLDLAESEAFIAAVGAAAERAGAEAAGVTLVSGASTVPGLVGLFAYELAAAAPGVARFAAWLSLGSRNPVGPGLLAGLLAPLGRERPEGGRALARSVAHRAGDGSVRRFGAWPSGLPGGAVGVEGRPVPLDFHVGFDRAPLTRALAAMSPLVRRLPAGAIPRLARAAAPLARLVRPFGTPRGSLRVEALDAAGAELAALELVAERDGLDVPAWPAVLVVERLVRAPAPVGARALDELVPFPQAAKRLRGAGFALRAGGQAGGLALST